MAPLPLILEGPTHFAHQCAAAKQLSSAHCVHPHGAFFCYIGNSQRNFLCNKKELSPRKAPRISNTRLSAVSVISLLLPYVGITRIKFKGSSPKTLSAIAPLAFSYYLIFFNYCNRIFLFVKVILKTSFHGSFSVGKEVF